MAIKIHIHKEADIYSLEVRETTYLLLDEPGFVKYHTVSIRRAHPITSKPWTIFKKDYKNKKIAIKYGQEYLGRIVVMKEAGNPYEQEKVDKLIERDKEQKISSYKSSIIKCLEYFDPDELRGELDYVLEQVKWKEKD